MSENAINRYNGSWEKMYTESIWIVNVWVKMAQKDNMTLHMPNNKKMCMEPILVICGIYVL